MLWRLAFTTEPRRKNAEEIRSEAFLRASVSP